MRTLKMATVELLIDGRRYKRHSPYTRDTMARRLLSARQKTDNPRPILGKLAYPVTAECHSGP